MRGIFRKVFLSVFVLSAVFIGFHPLNVSAAEIDESFVQEMQTENETDVLQDGSLSSGDILEGSSEDNLIEDEAVQDVSPDQVVLNQILDQMETSETLTADDIKLAVVSALDERESRPVEYGERVDVNEFPMLQGFASGDVTRLDLYNLLVALYNLLLLAFYTALIVWLYSQVKSVVRGLLNIG